MIYQIFSIILTALFLMFVFWALWYIAIPLLIVAIIFSAFGRLHGNIKAKIHKKHPHNQPICANDVIDVDFKEIK